MKIFHTAVLSIAMLLAGGCVSKTRYVYSGTPLTEAMAAVETKTGVDVSHYDYEVKMDDKIMFVAVFHESTEGEHHFGRNFFVKVDKLTGRSTVVPI